MMKSLIIKSGIILEETNQERAKSTTKIYSGICIIKVIRACSEWSMAIPSLEKKGKWLLLQLIGKRTHSSIIGAKFYKMKIECWAIGKPHESYVEEGINDFTKRIENYYPAGWRLFNLKKNSGNF